MPHRGSRVDVGLRKLRRIGYVANVAEPFPLVRRHPLGATPDNVGHDAHRHRIVGRCENCHCPDAHHRRALELRGVQLIGRILRRVILRSGQVLKITAGIPCCMYVAWSLEP